MGLEDFLVDFHHLHRSGLPQLMLQTFPKISQRLTIPNNQHHRNANDFKEIL